MPDLVEVCISAQPRLHEDSIRFWVNATLFVSGHDFSRAVKLAPTAALATLRNLFPQQ